MVEQSKVLNTSGAAKQTKRELFDALRQELESSVLEKASKSVWDLILDNDSLGKEISETVEKVFWRLSGREPPVAAPNEAHQEIEDREKEEGEKEREREVADSSGRKWTLGEISTQGKERDAPDSSVRKRSFSELYMQGKDTIANGLADVPPGTQDYSVPPSNSKA